MDSGVGVTPEHTMHDPAGVDERQAPQPPPSRSGEDRRIAGGTVRSRDGINERFLWFSANGPRAE